MGVLPRSGRQVAAGARCAGRRAAEGLELALRDELDEILPVDHEDQQDDQRPGEGPQILEDQPRPA